MDRIDELKNMIINITHTMNGLAEKLEQIDNELSELTTTSNKEVWQPKTGEEYYYIDDDGRIESDIYDGLCADIERVEFYNSFETEEMAERERFEILLYRKLKSFAITHNTETIDWDNCDQPKFHVYYNYLDNRLDTACSYTIRNSGRQVFFSSKSIAEQAKEQFKNELLRYFATNE